MKRLLAIALAASTAVVAVSAADASGGCGRGYHRGPHGGCRPSERAMIVAPGLVIGKHYRDRGYWDGHRYWHHRERWHGGWRYR